MNKKVLLFITLFLYYSKIPSITATDYFVSVQGSGNICTINSPCNLNSGLSKLGAGDTLYLLEGVYYQTLNFSKSGTPNSVINIKSAPGQTAVIDGTNSSVGSCYDFLVSISGSYVNLDSLQIKNAKGSGVYIAGTGSTIKNVHVENTGETGVVLSGTDNIADKVIVTKNGQSYGKTCNTWGSALCTTGKNATIQNSLVYNNVGEGLNAYAGSIGAVIQDNVSYDNKALNLYIDSSSGSLVRRNLIYYSSLYSQSRGRGITVGGETGTISDLTIANNLVVGGFVNFEIDSNVTHLNKVTIAYNTFVNAKGDSSSYNMGVYFRPTITSFTDSYFINNLIIEEATNRVPIYISTSHNGLIFSNNTWGKTPSAGAVGMNDIICPNLTCSLSKDGNLFPGQLSANWFKPLSNSQVINKAKVISNIGDDFFKNLRDTTPDIGGIELLANSTITPVPTYVNSVYDVNGDLKVDLIDVITILIEIFK